MKSARGFTLIELVAVLAIIAVVTFMVSGRGENDAYERQVAMNEAAKIRFFVGKGFAQARNSNEPIEVVASGHQILLRGARSGRIYDTLQTEVYTASATGVTSTLFPSGAVTGGDCTLAFSGSSTGLKFAVQPGGVVKEVTGDSDCPTNLAVVGDRPSLPTGSGGTSTGGGPPPPPPTPIDLDPPPPPGGSGETGSLRVNIDNPASSGAEPEGDVDVFNDEGLVRNIDHDTLLTPLNVGNYKLVAKPITLHGCAFAPVQREVNVAVMPDDTSVATVRYEGTEGKITSLTLNGASTTETIPLDREGGTAVLNIHTVGAKAITVSDSPNDFSGDLPYSFSNPEEDVHKLTFTYTANTEPQPKTTRLVIDIDGCSTSGSESVDILQEAGSAPLTLTVSGLPGSEKAAVHLESPDSRCETRDVTLGNETVTWELPATCDYKIWGERIVAGGNYYDASPLNFTLAAYTARDEELVYDTNQGRLTVKVAGLPPGSPSATVKVTGPVDKTATIASGSTHSFTLPPGHYEVTITPDEVASGGVRYRVDKDSVETDVTNDSSETITFTYSPLDAWLTLKVSGFSGAGEKTVITVASSSAGFNSRYTLYADGSKTITVPPGRYEITATDTTHYSVTNSPQRLAIASGGRYTVSFRFKRKTGILRIRVDHYKAWADGVGTVRGDGDAGFEYKDFTVPTGKYAVKAVDSYIYDTTAPQHRYRLISPNNVKVTVYEGRRTTATMNYIIEGRDLYCVLFYCWWGSWHKVRD